MVLDITFIKGFLATGNKKEFLRAIIIVEGILTFAFVVSSFVVAGTANAGFNCVLTGFLNAAFTAGSYYVIENSKAPIAVRNCLEMCIKFLIRVINRLAF